MDNPLVKKQDFVNSSISIQEAMDIMGVEATDEILSAADENGMVMVGYVDWC